MESAAFTTVLGHPRVLPESLPDARRRVLAYDGDQVIGVAVYEPLFGHQAEAAIALAPESTGALTAFLLDGLLELASGAGITALRFAFGTPRQRRLAAQLTSGRPSCSLRSDRLEIRTDVDVSSAACRTALTAR